MLRSRGVRLLGAGLSVLLSLAGCGGARAGGGAAAGGGDTARAESESESGGERETLPLDPPRVVAGTGVTLRAPRGSEPTPFGAGFVHRARRIQLLVAAAQGGERVLEAFRRGVDNEAEVISTEEVQISGRTVTLHVDQQETGQEMLIERVWILVTEGDRAFVVAGAYDASRAARVRDLVRASVLTAEWDPTAPLDPEAAVGFRIQAPPTGLVLDRTTTSSVTYGVEGHMSPPELGSPTLFLIAIPAAVPLAQRDEACEPILFQAGPISDDHVRTRARIETDTVEGCEVTGWQENDGPDGEPVSLATYAAIIYLADETFLVAGVVAESDRDAWLPRFAEAARTVAPAH
jgi:hypothetical protein